MVASSAPRSLPRLLWHDMARLGDFVAFQAAISLIKERDMEHLIDEVYAKCKAQIELPKEENTNG